MEKHNLSDFPGGWIVGNFTPAIFQTPDVEICVKSFRQGERETTHYQKSATEITVVISGDCQMGDVRLEAGEILVIRPLLPSDFVALTDCVVMGVKWPSTPGDKVLGLVQ